MGQRPQAGNRASTEAAFARDTSAAIAEMPWWFTALATLTVLVAAALCLVEQVRGLRVTYGGTVRGHAQRAARQREIAEAVRVPDAAEGRTREGGSP